MNKRTSRDTAKVRVAIDTGGTFTDFVSMKDGGIDVHKVRSTPDDPSRAVIAGISDLSGELAAGKVIHGSTVATNALLEGKGGRTALVTTSGFEDIIEIGRQTRSRIYDIMVDRPPPLVKGPDRYGLSERVGPFGELEEEVDLNEIGSIAKALGKKRIEAIAVCFLNSYANPCNEQAVEESLETAGNWLLSVSSRILPEYREYERCSTTVVNAYVSVLMAEYLERLGREIGIDILRVMQSNGGFISVGRAVDEPVRTILSGPAGGVIGALETGKLSGYEDIISFDMGGTSTDVCLCMGEVNTTTEAEMGGYPIRVPVMDIHTVGAGGGSIAWVDRGGALRVGPMSSGADPGPICYGRGDRLTVTDAHLFLGRLEEKWFLDGKISLDEDKVESAIRELAAEIGKDPRETAMGIIEVANINMERAIRVISLERGHDPRGFTLVTFGGAGPLHACDIAEDLSISTILIPDNPGALSAVGMLMTDVVTDHSASVLKPWEDWQGESSEGVFSRLDKKASQEMTDEVDADGTFSLVRSLDMRFVGQSYELNVVFSESSLQQFHSLHESRYGYSDPGKAVEVVAARVRGIGSLSRPEMSCEELSGEDPSRALIGEREACFRSGPRKTGVYLRGKLEPGNRVKGPALLVEYTATSLIPPGYCAMVDGYRNLILNKNG
jgi:N-methylhydantoinase A